MAWQTAWQNQSNHLKMMEWDERLSKGVNVHQKLTHHCKPTILQLKKIFKLKKILQLITGPKHLGKEAIKLEVSMGSSNTRHFSLSFLEREIAHI